MSQTVSAPPLVTQRKQLLQSLQQLQQVDLLVIGGGASGLGVALDASLRGLSVALLESHDFASGTSSRATKLVHGGVRYLAQGNISLVREALHERRALLENAPHLAHSLGFIMPAYHCWQLPFYGAGLKLYDALAGADSLGSTQWLGPQRTQELLPGVQASHLRGAVRYWDGQFDDARLALALARSAAASGALVLNYCPVVDVLHENGRACGVRWRASCGADLQGELRARCIVNATGVWVDDLRRLDDAARGEQCAPLVAPSQGVHLVVDRSFLPSNDALLVPRTHDGRVLFAVPWLGHLILGTTDTARADTPREPQALPEEVNFILRESAKVLARAPQPADILSVWVGLRPLVRPSHAESSKSISREHTVSVSNSGMVTVTGGKWTTYRSMANDVLQHCVKAGLLPGLPACRTHDYRLLGAPANGASRSLAQLPGLHSYGSEAGFVQSMPGTDVDLGLGLNAAMVRYAIRHEYALTVEDILARRHRMLFLHARLACAAAETVAGILLQETGSDGRPGDFQALCQQYSQLPTG